MTAVIRGRAFGRAFEVRLPDDASNGVGDALPWSWRPFGGGPERIWELELFGGDYWAMVDGEVIGRWADAAYARHMLLSALELWIAEHAEDRVFVHAGCVVVNGRAIVLPGRTHAGKSTLTAALVRAGATYYSDEFTVLDLDGCAHPYARRLAIRKADGELGERVDVDMLGGVVGNEAAPVGLVAQLQYAPGATWQVQALTPGRTVLAMMDNTVPAQARPHEVMTALTAAASGATGVVGVRSDAAVAAARLIDLLKSGEGG